MSTIRLKRKRHNFVTIDKTPLEDSRLTYKARGILAYLLCKPDDWSMSVKNLVNQSPDGKTAVSSGLKELEEIGYLIRNRVRDEMGRIAGWESIIFETPEDAQEWLNSNSTITRFSDSGFSDSGKTDAGKTDAGKTDVGKSVDIINNEEQITKKQINEFNPLITAANNATLVDAAAEREGGGNEFEENQEVDTPHIVNSQEFVANGKSNQVDKKSAPAPREVVMTSHLETATKYLKAVGIRGNKTLNEAIAAKTMDEVVMALGFLLEKELDNYQNGKEPIHNKAGFFKRALEDDSALDWLEMMDYAQPRKEMWRWGMEARLKGFARGTFLDTNSFVIDDQISLNLDECFNCWKSYGWDEFERILSNSIKKIREAA